MASNFPAGTRPILIQGADGLCRPTGMALLPNGQTCNCGTPRNWTAQQPSAYNSGKFALMLSPQAQAQAAQQMQSGASAIGNTFQGLDLPNMGASGIGRMEANASPARGNVVYSLVLDNTLGATPARQFLGDYFSTYTLLGNNELTPVGFVIGGSWTTNSKTQFAGRGLGRPLRVKKIQFIASDATYFDAAQIFYFDTQPIPNAPTKDNLSLANLLSADQYNPKIQWFTESVRFDGITGLDVTVPAGVKLTINFTIESEASGGAQVLIGSGN